MSGNFRLSRMFYATRMLLRSLILAALGLGLILAPAAGAAEYVPDEVIVR